MEIVKKKNLIVMEDTCESLSSKYESGDRSIAFAKEYSGHLSYGAYQMYSKGGKKSVVGKFIK